jgi:hypothetical protein
MSTRSSKSGGLTRFRFMAYGGVFGFSKALVKRGEANLPALEEMVIDETTDIGKLQAAAVKRNVTISCEHN